MSDNQLILVIPGVFSNLKEERIRRIFDSLNIGEVTQVDIVAPKTPVDSNGKKNNFNRVFVHINLNDSPTTVAVRERLLAGKELKIIYDDPWFWKVSAYGLPAPPKLIFETSDNRSILVIPRVFPNITEEKIHRIFDDLNIGDVERVDIKSKTTDKGEKFNRVFIHINWNDSKRSVKARERLLQGKDIKIIYDEPWFWRVSAYRPPAGGRKRKTIKRRKSIRKRKSIKRRHY
jgi:hypothetical protein